MNCLKPYIWKPLRLSNSPRFIAPLATLSNNTNKIEPTDLIHKVNLCVGTIIEAERHPEAEHLYIEKGKIVINIKEKKKKKVIKISKVKKKKMK